MHLCLKVINNTGVPGTSHVAIFTLSLLLNLVSKYHTKPGFFSTCSCMSSWILSLSTQVVLVRTAVFRSQTHVLLCAPQTEAYTNKIWDLIVWARSFSWRHKQMNAWGGNSCTDLDLVSDLSGKTLGMCREWNLTQEKCRDVAPGDQETTSVSRENDFANMYVTIFTSSSSKSAKDWILAHHTDTKGKKTTGTVVLKVKLKSHVTSQITSRKQIQRKKSGSACNYGSSPQDPIWQHIYF